MKREFLLLASLRFVKISLSVVILILYARAFGIGIQMDSWVFSSGIAASVGLALWGPLNEIVRSRFVRQVAEVGEESARVSGTSLLVFTSTLSVLVCIVLYLSAPQIVNTFYVAKEPALILRLFVLMIPSIALGQVLSLGTAYMNCYDVIYTPEFIGIAAALLNLICVIALTPLLGIYSLVCGYYFGALISLIVVLRFLSVYGFLRRTTGAMRILQDARAAFIFAAPLFLSYGAGQLNGLFEKYLASVMGVGVLSSINYASQIKSTLQAVLTSVMFSLIVPRLTHAASRPNGEGFKHIFAESQRVAMLFLLIVLPFMFGAADALAAILFGKVSTSAGAIKEIALLIRLYIMALVPVVLYLVYGVALLAQQKSNDYATFGVTAQLLSALICLTLYHRLGSIVFPIALLLSHMVAALLMLQRIDVQRRHTLLIEAATSVALIAVAAVAGMLTYRSLIDWFHSVWLGLGILVLTYGLVVLFILFLQHFKKAEGKLKVWTRKI